MFDEDDDVIETDDVELDEDESSMTASDKKTKEKEKLDVRRRLEEYLETRRMDKELSEY